MNKSDSLLHYGVKGMKWGIRKDVITVSKQMKLSEATIKNARTSNIDKWGTSKETNTLYITGYSGSGKSTVARKLADENTNIIHLDSFFEKMDSNVASSIKDKEFVSYLDKNLPNHNLVNRSDRHSKQWWSDVDSLMDHVEKFSQGQFSKGKRVIVEGVQLADETTHPDKGFFKNKPVMILSTNSKASMFRAWERDDMTGKVSEESMKEYIQWYGNMRHNLDKLSLTVQATKGENFVYKQLLKRGGNNE